jgi:peroxiredoxin
MIRRILVSLSFMFLVAAPMAYCAKETVGPKGEVSNKLSAPEFSLQDLSGKTWSLSNQKGKAVLLVFTTTWCPWCVKDIPNLKKIHEKYKNRNFEFVAVYINESKQKVSSFAQKKALPYRVLLDPDGKIATKYGVRGVPTKVIVGKDGNVVCWMCQDEETQLDKALKK